MSFNLNLKNTNVFLAIKREKFPLLRFSNILANVFLVLSVMQALFLLASFFDYASAYVSAKMLALFFSCFAIFWNINLFKDLKIKRPETAPNIMDASVNPEAYNLAGFLDFNSARLVIDCINFCNKRKIAVNATSLLYSAAKLSIDVSLICARLGLNPKKLQSDLKNYLEKMQRGDDQAGLFLDDFQKTIERALKIAVSRKHGAIGEKEILTALAYESEFFKDVLMQHDLKTQDVENLTAWLDSAQDLMQRSRRFWSQENLASKGSVGKDWVSGYTVNLDRFSIDWRKIVSGWNFREIIGHKREIEETEVILAKSDLANVLLVGDEGAGRKSIVQAIAQKCYLGLSLPQLNNKRVVELDPVLLAAQIPDFEKLEIMLDMIFREVTNSGNVILVIDNLENFVGQRAQKAGAFDISAVLAKYLALPRFQFIGITTYEGLHKNIEENPSFAQAFQKVEVAEISEAETINVLQTSALELEYAHKILILYPAIREIVNLAARYIPSLPFPKKGLDILNEAVVYVQRQREKIVMPHHIAEIISKRTDIPMGKMELKEKETLLNLEKLIHNRIVNQKEAVNEISIAMRRARMGIASKTRPMGTFLFLGPTGVGKTETAKALSQIYFGSEQKMIRLDMSEFQSVSDVARLIGAVTPVEMQGLLTTPVRETPFSLVLVDEIEKAHPNILNLFLQILDEGRITDGQGRKVVFSNAIIICTSNAGAETIFKQVALGQPLVKDKLLEELFAKKIFRPEFVNRFDATVLFHPLTKENLMDIAELSLQALKKNLKEKDIDLEITAAVKAKIVELSYKPQFGAREMRRVVQDKIESVVATALLEEKIKKGDVIEVDPENFEIISVTSRQD